MCIFVIPISLSQVNFLQTFSAKSTTMKKLTLILTVVLLFSIKSYSQTDKTPAESQQTTFCGKAGDNATKEATFAIEELKKCDWKIQTVDSNYTVFQFKLTMIAREKPGAITEYEIKGNTIPEKYSNEILDSAKKVFLEYIKVGKNKDERINARPIAIRILS